MSFHSKAILQQKIYSENADNQNVIGRAAYTQRLTETVPAACPHFEESAP